MKPVSDMKYHPLTEDLVKVLCNQTQNFNPKIFRLMLSYYLAKVASMMRCSIQTLDRGPIPVNVYVINLAVSGFGKGHSINIIEDNLIAGFKETFLEETFPLLAEESLYKLAAKRAIRKQTDEAEELEFVKKEFENTGALLFSFDSGTAPAIKQLRHKLLMANLGSLNSEIDEIGSNFLGAKEIIDTFLELYDVGKIKPKLVKNTAESKRNEHIDGRTPCNLLMFGTPIKLLDGGKTEDDFLMTLDSGYGRRCLFGYARTVNKPYDMTPQERLDTVMNFSKDDILEACYDHFSLLAKPEHANKTLVISKDVTLALIEYQIWCEKRANELSEYEDIKKAELIHRYFKTMKLAGAYAFADMSAEITLEHLEAAIKLVEDSGQALHEIMTRERPYVKLAKYIAECDEEVTHADLVEDLPFFKGSDSNRKEMLRLATAWGYKNNIIIQRSYMEGIEFLRGESLKVTNLDEMILSYSDHQAYNYENVLAPFSELETLTQQPNLHWVNHHFDNGHRVEDEALAGFNMVVLDIDGECSIETAKLLLEKYTYHIYTTKRHTPEENRFRVIIPTNYVLKLDAKDYAEFMRNLYEYFPLGASADSQTGQRARKWLTHQGDFIYHEGELLDVLPFIPKTSKNEEYKRQLSDLGHLDNLERWFIENTGLGNRSNQLVKYALLLVDMGADIGDVEDKVKSLNNKMADKLADKEIEATILITASKAIVKRDNP